MKNMKTDEEIREEWYEFATDAFMEWRGNTRKTLTEFADWIGISQPVMSLQMKKGGSIPKDFKTINAWCNRYGAVRIYSILGLTIKESVDSIDSLPEPTRSIAREIRETVAEYNVAFDSPKAMQLQEEILKKYGFEIISKDSSSSEQ